MNSVMPPDWDNEADMSYAFGQDLESNIPDLFYQGHESFASSVENPGETILGHAVSTSHERNHEDRDGDAAPAKRRRLQNSWFQSQ
jgi:hypothetical protein